jgi:hypothetical protein
MNSIEVWTNTRGDIVDASGEAAALLNISERAVRHRPIHLFFNSQRDRLFRALEVASRGHCETLTAVLRPRERRVVAVAIEMEQDPESPELVRWTITPVENLLANQPEHA